MGAYSVTEAQLPRDRELVISLWEGNLGDRRRAENKFDWWYTDATRMPIVLLLWSGDQPIGTAMGMPRTFRVPYGTEIGMLCGDFTVAPGHRNLFAALRLFRAMNARGLMTSSLMYCIPNAYSQAVLRRAKSVELKGLRRRVYVVRSSAYLGKWLPNVPAKFLGALMDMAQLALTHSRRGATLLIEHHDQAPSAIDDVWEKSKLVPVIMGERTQEFARFRFDKQPLRHFHYLVVREPGTNQSLGWFVYEMVGDEWQIHDWLVVGLHTPMVGDCFCALLRVARAAGAQTVSLVFCGPRVVERRLVRSGFLARDKISVFIAIADAAAPRLAGVPWLLSKADNDC